MRGGGRCFLWPILLPQERAGAVAAIFEADIGDPLSVIEGILECLYDIVGNPVRPRRPHKEILERHLRVLRIALIACVVAVETTVADQS